MIFVIILGKQSNAGPVFFKGCSLPTQDRFNCRQFGGLYKLYTRLTEKLDSALEKLDQLTKTLLRKYYRALQYLEKLFEILRKLLRVIFPILFLFVPPATGVATAYLAYEKYLWDSVVLGSMSAVLLLILIASFRSKAEFAAANIDLTTQTPFKIASELDDVGIWRKSIGSAIAIVALGASAYLSIGLFAGLLMFIAEVIVLYILKWMYGPGERTDNLTTA